MPLLEKARIEAYIPDLPDPLYDQLRTALEDEFTYTFGGCSIHREVDGRYLSHLGQVVPNRIAIVYVDTPLAFSTRRDLLERYGDWVKAAIEKELPEEAVLVVVSMVYHVS